MPSGLFIFSFLHVDSVRRGWSGINLIIFTHKLYSVYSWTKKTYNNYGFLIKRSDAIESGSVNYGNLNNNASDIKTLPLLAKRIHIRFHSIFDTMRFQDQREEGIEWINRKMEEGILKPIISKVFNLEDIVDAHKYLEAASHVGKVIVVT